MSDNQMHPLVNGIAVIIDDKIGTGDDLIDDLIDQIERFGVPCLKYTELPRHEEISHYHGISFVLLDWRLHDNIEGVSVPDSILQPSIEFLCEIKEKLFVPVFIFTNENVDTIETKLAETEEELYYKDGRPNFIFVKSKSELKDDSLFTKISNWINTTPPVYVLKTWEHQYRVAKGGLFAELYTFNPSWVTVLKKCFKGDNLPMPAVSVEIMNLIKDNLFARMRMTGLEEANLGTEINSFDREQIRSILEHSRFIENDKLSADEVRCGDVFSSENKYFINIRPDCDCIPDRNDPTSTIDDVKLYLLGGSIVNNEKKEYSKKLGQLSPQATREHVFCMYQNKSLFFDFKDFTIEEYGQIKSTKPRIGRLLPPFSTQICTRYAQYLLRQGLPRIPPEAISDE